MDGLLFVTGLSAGTSPLTSYIYANTAVAKEAIQAVANVARVPMLLVCQSRIAAQSTLRYVQRVSTLHVDAVPQHFTLTSAGIIIAELLKASRALPPSMKHAEPAPHPNSAGDDSLVLEIIEKGADFF